MTTSDARDRALSRREFFQWGVAAVGGIFSLLLGIPLIGYFFSVLLQTTPEQWVRVCTLDQIDTVQPKLFQVAFAGQKTYVAYKDVRGVFVIRRDDQVLAFTNTCTHMGCSVRWLAWRQQILCPCHGGMYDRWGNLVGGPPPRSLPFYVSRIEGQALYVANRYVQRG